jgi:hypothetical protein
MDPGSNAPRVSIGLPVYDGERYLRAALDGLLSQTVADFELIIADNASTDDTEAICREYGGGDPRIRYLRTPTNVGSLRNFNLTFGDARGAYFKWAAHDDLLKPEFLARCLEPLERDPTVVLSHSYTRIIDEHGTAIGDYANDLGHASDARPSRRFRDVLAEDRWCFEFYGAVRASALRSTRLLGGHVGADRRFSPSSLCAAALQRCPTTCFSAETTPNAQFVGFGPSSTCRLRESRARGPHRVLPHWRILVEYARAVHGAGLPAAERAHCYAALVRWLAHHSNWARLAVDPMIAVPR